MQSSLGVRTAAVVVGREVELQHLRQALEAAARGASSHTVLVGDGGVGKSRLLSETVAHARQRGLDVLAGRARVTTRAPFGVIAEALRSWLRAHPATLTNSPFDHGLRLVLPEWDAPAGEPNDLSGAQLRLLALEGVVVLLRQIARAGRGALLTLDDLHLADADSMEVLQYVSAAGIDGLAIVAALRRHESEVGDEYVRASRGDSGQLSFDSNRCRRSASASWSPTCSTQRHQPISLKRSSRARTVSRCWSKRLLTRTYVPALS